MNARASVSRSGAGPRLRLRTRLALWYALVVFLVLVGAGASVLWLQGRLGLARVDEEGVSASIAVAGVLQNELGEGLSVADAVPDIMSELNLTRTGFAIVGLDGTVHGTKTGYDPRASAAVLRSAPEAPATLDAAGTPIRIRATRFHHGDHELRIVTWASLQPLEAERRTLERALLLGIPLAVLMSVLGGLAIGRRGLDPLAAMARQAEHMGGANQDARLTIASPADELGTVGRAFNGVLDRLSASMHQQCAFMADASHQLRTPVSVIRTAAQVTLDRQQRTDAEYRESLDVIARQAQRLTKMVDDMFVLARVDAEARPLQLTPLYLDEVAAGVVDDCRVLSEAQGVRLHMDSSGEAPLVGDEHLLRQLLMNLIENAIRHTPRDGTVSVSLAPVAGAWHIAVADSGSGIPAADAERIFDRFVRLDGAGSEAGAGLGLPIARWIAEAHGGTLALRATGPAGSRFVVTLPAGPSATAVIPRSSPPP
ncbi:MAG: ATP-binding protein [Vicinamibacteraceae bacterium]